MQFPALVALTGLSCTVLTTGALAQLAALAPGEPVTLSANTLIPLGVGATGILITGSLIWKVSRYVALFERERADKIKADNAMRNRLRALEDQVGMKNVEES